MKTSDAGIKLLKEFEGLRLTAYKCLPSEKYFTIGYGHYGPDVKIGMRITAEQAEQMLRNDLSRYEENVMRYDRVYNWTQNEFDALVSFCYNIGSIDQLTNYGKRDKKTIAEKMLLYVNSGGVRLQGLVNRRIKENALFTSGGQIMAPAMEIAKPTLRRGMKNNKQVRILQQNLNLLLNCSLEIDGSYGPLTKQAVTVFQQKCYGTLYFDKIDGIYGPHTASALRDAISLNRRCD